MKIRLFTVLLLVCLLLTACGKVESGVETTAEPETEASATTTAEATGADTESESLAETEETTAEPIPPEEEKILLPKPYVDIDFTEDGKAVDRIGRVTCEVVDEKLGRVESGALSFDGEEYEVPHYRVYSAGGVLKMKYKKIQSIYDLYADLTGGLSMEAFVVNFNRLESNAKEQMFVGSCQSGGYNLTILNGKYAASVYSDGAYANTHYETAYSTVELTHLVSVYDPNTESLSFYVNGELVDVAKAPGLLGLASGEAYKVIVLGGDIGSDGVTTTTYAASMAATDFKLYRTTLSEEQVEAAYARAVAELTGEDPEIAFVEGDSDVIADENALFPTLLDSFAMDLYAPDTELVNAPTVLQYATAENTSVGDEKVRPATMVYECILKNGKLYGADRNGAELGSLRSLVQRLDRNVIPAFRFKDRAVGTALAEFINENNIADCFVISSDAKLLAQVADSTCAARPLLDCTSLKSIDPDQLYLDTAKVGVKTVLLPLELMTTENMLELRRRSVAAVAVIPDGADVADVHNAIVLMSVGILTDDYDAVFEYYETFDRYTLGLTPLLVAHRGDPEHCPDNMLRSLASAAESGATTIELDVWLTSDGHLVLNHDAKTTHFSEQLDCKKSTRAQLEALTYTGAFAKAGDKIAFLDEVFEAFSTTYTDKLLTIEVKDAREKTVDAIAALAKEYGMESRIVLIGMNHLISNYTYEKYGLGAQMNQSYLVKKNNPELSLKLGVIESTHLHSSCFTQHSQENASFIEMMHHRLIKYSTWTSKTYEETMKNYLCGVPEYTSNFPHALDDMIRYLKAETASDGTVKVIAVTYVGETVDVTEQVELKVLSGSVKQSGGKISGSGQYAFAYKATVPHTGSVYYLYSNALTVK